MATTSTETQSPNGPAWAAILAAGVGCAAFGFLVDLAEASKAASNHLNLYNPAGDLSGKSTVAVVVWLATWGILHAKWKRRTIESPGWIMVASFLLVLLALVSTFPPFIDLFAAK